MASSYELEGSYLEACNCEVVCPCGAGKEPDKGTCEQIYAYHIDRGTIRDVDVAGLTFLLVGRSDGRVLDGNLHESFFVDERATPEQREALLDAFEGRLGGPLGELANLIGERLGVHDAPIDFDFSDSGGKLTVGNLVQGSTADHQPDEREQAKLAERGDRIGASSASVGTTSGMKVDIPEDGIAFQLEDTNVVRAHFHFAA